MAIPFSELPENPLNFERFKKNQNIAKRKKINPNLSSVWAFLSSIFIYISVFYMFNLSPSTLIFTTKFWFFISNTLVLIIAVDFTAFSSTKQLDFHDDHVIKDTTVTLSFENTTSTSSKNNTVMASIYEKEKHMIKNTTTTSSKNNTVMVTIYKKEKHMIEDTTATSSRGHDVVPFGTMTSHDMKEEEKRDENIINAVDGCHEKKQEKCERTAVDEEAGKAMVLHRPLSERHDCEEQSLEDEKINEFSRMSNEELNRRVEEFIRKFNRQIRLQAVRNRHNLGMNKIH